MNAVDHIDTELAWTSSIFFCKAVEEKLNICFCNLTYFAYYLYFVKDLVCISK